MYILLSNYFFYYNLFIYFYATAGVVLYILLNGAPPFSAGRKSTADIIRLTCKCKPRVSGDSWECISDEGRDLVVKMLERDHSKRITTAQVGNEARKEGWMVKDGCYITIILIITIINNEKY